MKHKSYYAYKYKINKKCNIEFYRLENNDLNVIIKTFGSTKGITLKEETLRSIINAYENFIEESEDNLGIPRKCKSEDKDNSTFYGPYGDGND